MRGQILEYKNSFSIQMRQICTLLFAVLFLGTFLVPSQVNAAYTFAQTGTDNFGDVGNSDVSVMEAFGDYVYACSTHAGGVQIWRTNDPTNINGIAVSAVWTKVVNAGFGDALNGACHDMLVFDNQLYLSTRKEVNPGELWRTSDGISWSQVGSDGFGDLTNYSPGQLAEFGGRIYANTINSTSGSEVWRSDASGNNFSLIAITDGGFGDAFNTTPQSGVSYNGFLYFGNYNLATGGEVWRSSNGTSWAQVNSDGFGDSDNLAITDMVEFGSELFLSTANGTTGGQLWKTSTGTNPASFSSVAGITEAASFSIETLHVRNNLLFLSTLNFASGAKVWTTTNGSLFTQQNVGGFGDASYYQVSAVATINGVTTFSANTAGGAMKLFYPDLSPIVSAVTASQRNDGTGYVDLSFDILTPDGTNEAEALVQFDLGGGFSDGYLLETDANTTAIQGDPKVLNANTNQIGNGSGYILTASGTNNVTTVWHSKRDNANVSQANTLIRVRGFSGTNGSYVSTPAFSVNNSDLIAPTTTASPAGGVYINGQTVVLTCNDGNGAGCDKTYYTVNGTTPTTASSVYSGPITISQSAALKYFSVDFAGNAEQVQTELYTITSNGPALRLIKTVLSTSGATDGQDIKPGDILTYFVEYQNLGLNSATGVILTDSIPSYTFYKPGSIVLNGAQLTDAQDADAADVNATNKNQFTFNLGTIRAGTSGRLSFQVEVLNTVRSGDVVMNEMHGRYNPFNLSVISNQTRNAVNAEGELGGIVFDDDNKNGALDLSEAGLVGLTVRIFDDNNRNGVIDAGDTGAFIGTTDAQGKFLTTGMSAGFYLIQIDDLSLGPLYTLTTGNNPGQAVLKDSLQKFTRAHFGYHRKATVLRTVLRTIIGGSTISTLSTNTNINQSSTSGNTNSNVITNRNVNNNQNVNVAVPTNTNEQVVYPVKPPTAQESSSGSFLEPFWSNQLLQSIIQFGVAPLIAIVALSNMLATISIINTLWPFLRYLSHAFTEPLRFFGMKKRKNWGKVYNTLTKEPIDLAIVRLFEKETNKLVESFISDAKGRYYFLAEPDTKYYLSVKRDGFVFPSKLPFDIKNKDELYSGGSFSFTAGEEDKTAGISKGGVVSFDVPLDPEVGVTYLDDTFRKPIKTAIADYGTYNSLSQIERDIENKKVVRAIRFQKASKVISYLGPILGLVAFTLSPTVWMGVLLGIHIILFLLIMRLAAKRMATPWGNVFDKDSGGNLSKTIVRLFEPKFGRMLHTRITTSNGRYGFLVGDQDYILVPEHQDYHYPGKKLNVTPKNGIVKEDIGLNKKK